VCAGSRPAHNFFLKLLLSVIWVLYLLELWPRDAIIFLPKSKDKTLQIVAHCDIIWGCATIKFYAHMHTTTYILNITFYWWLMATGKIFSVVFNFVTHGDHAYKAIYERSIYIGGHLKLWVKDGDDCDTFVVVVIMTKDIVGHVLKDITCHHLLLKICTCGTIRGWATIKIDHKNKFICTRIVMHCGTIWMHHKSSNYSICVFVQVYPLPRAFT